MGALIAALAVSALALTPSLFFASPTVYPTGTTIYKPEKAWNGFTVYQTMAAPGAVLIDMNGNVRASWKHLVGEAEPRLRQGRRPGRVLRSGPDAAHRGRQTLILSQKTGSGPT